MPDLEDRVAALEELVLHPPHFVFPPAPSLTEAQEAELREAIGEAAKLGPFTHRLLSSPSSLTPDQVRYLLRECVTVVKPGETLAVRVPWDTGPTQVAEYQRYVNEAIESGYIPFRVLILAGDELGVAEAEPEFMSEVRTDTWPTAGGAEDVRMTHLPTGVTVLAPTRSEAVAKLGRALEGYAQRHAGGVPGAA